MTPDAVLRCLDRLNAAGACCWVDGGWGIDALLGHQTREHSDLDLVVDDEDLVTVIDVLRDEGYATIRDWLPTAIALRQARDGSEVDLHPVRRTADGGGDQVQLDGTSVYHYDPPVHGMIGGRTVLCCSVDDQVRCHRGYEPADKDRRDMKALATAFNTVGPEPYE